MNTSRKVNDYHILNNWQKGGDMKLSNAIRLFDATITIKEVIDCYDRLPKGAKMNVIYNEGIEHKTVMRWKRGECEPMYRRLVSFYNAVRFYDGD